MCNLIVFVSRFVTPQGLENIEDPLFSLLLFVPTSSFDSKFLPGHLFMWM